MIYKKRNMNHKLGMKITWRFTVLCTVLCISLGKVEIVRAASAMHYQVVGTGDDEQGKHMIDIDVSVLNYAVMSDCENTSEFKISLMNTGTEQLTKFEGTLAEQGMYELYCEEDGVRHKLLSNEANQDELEEISDKKAVLPDTLNPGDIVTIYAIPLPEGDADVDKPEELFIVYTEETGRYEVPLTIPVQTGNQEEGGQEDDQLIEEREEEQEIISEEMTESAHYDEEEKNDIESKLDIELETNGEKKNVDQNNGTNEENLVSGKGLNEEDGEKVSNEGDESVKSPPDEFICEVESIERTKGSNMDNIFFAEKDSQYIVHFSTESTVDELNYQIGTFSGMISVKDGFAAIGIPDNISGYLEISCTDQNKNKVVLCSEYVVNENIAPTVHYEKIEKDGRLYAVVTVKDYGDVTSGLSNCSVCMNGDFIEESESSVLEMVNLFNECEVVSSRQYTILLENGKIHNFEVSANDYTGNSIKEDFSFETEAPETEEKEIVNVVLPTSFNILVLPDDQENQLYGEDIILCNKSDFPVQVDVTSAQVQVDNTIPENADSQMNPGDGSLALNKSFDLSLQLLQADQSVKSIKLPEGNTENIASFVLSEKNSATDVEALQKSEINEVVSSDYAALNIRGTMDQNTEHYWKNDDLHVKIVFQFHKLGETD